MSRELEVEVDTASVERVRADVAAVPLFAGERPLQGSAGRADWRLCGSLSELMVAGRLEGRPGEAVLVSTFGGLRVPLLLMLGAGSRADFDVRRFEALVKDAVERAIALRARSLALPFPLDPGGQVAHERRAVALLAGAAEAVAGAPAPLELELRLLVPGEEVTRTADLLRRARPARFPDSVALRLPGPTPARAGPRRRDSAEPPRGAQPIK